jgi:Zn-dependent peptidase ImmA (M78 family)/DNA-binding XRE family transcriptional regulator
MNQDDVAAALGFKKRQTLSAIETGERKVSAEELVKLADLFNVELTVFTDPYIVVDEAGFSWRRSEIPDAEIRQFEDKAKGWLALYRHLSRVAGEPVNSLVPSLDLSEKSSFEDAASEGEAIASQFDLGLVPAIALETVLQEKLNVVVLQVDAPEGLSGAACRLGGLNFVLVNRAEPAARRAFNLAHELFHLATWEKMPPEHIESVRIQGRGRPRAEQLADNFASALLMPRRALEAALERHSRAKDADPTEWIMWLADDLGVSGLAMKWRLVNLGFLKRALAESVNDEDLRLDHDPIVEPHPLPFSQRFVARLHWGLEGGHLTVRKAAQVMDMTIDDLQSLFETHGMPVPFDL